MTKTWYTKDKQDITRCSKTSESARFSRNATTFKNKKKRLRLIKLLLLLIRYLENRYK